MGRVRSETLGHILSNEALPGPGNKTFRCRRVGNAVTKPCPWMNPHRVCPCCQRSFQNVKAHMTRQHPDYGDA